MSSPKSPIWPPTGRQLIKNKLAVRLTSALSLRDGYVTDRVPAIEAVNKTNFFGLRGSRLYTPTNRVTLTLRGNYGRDNNAENTFVYASKPDYNPVGIRADEGLNTSQNLPNDFNREQYGGMGKLEVKLGHNTLTAITALNRSVDSNYGDNDVSAADASRWGRTQTLQTFSQELRINSPRDQKFAYVAGLYYLNERISVTDTFTLSSIKTSCPWLPSCWARPLPTPAGSRVRATPPARSFGRRVPPGLYRAPLKLCPNFG